MLQRLYVHNFRCLENFELNLKDLPSSLLIGKNGTGKSTIASALEVLQSIGRGINRVSQLIQTKDFNNGRSGIPIRFEIEVLLKEQLYKYVLALSGAENSGESHLETVVTRENSIRKSNFSRLAEEAQAGGGLLLGKISNCGRGFCW